MPNGESLQPHFCTQETTHDEEPDCWLTPNPEKEVLKTCTPATLKLGDR